MTKNHIRQLKSHFQDRWYVMRHNQKHNKKILLIEDAWLIKRFNLGRTLMYDCLGEMFQGIAGNFDAEPQGQYDNVLMINNLEFKYLDPEQLYDRIAKTASRYLQSHGRMFCTINHRYLRYNRINLPVEHAFDSWYRYAPLRLRTVQWLPGKARISFGDIWFDLEND